MAILGFAGEWAAIWAIAFAANLAAYFGLGLALDRINRAHPERRIQTGRDGMRRARAEIRESVRSIAATALCLSLAIALSRGGWTLWTPPEGAGWPWTLGAALGLILGYDAWYYWMHRLMHTERLWAWHAWHHRSVAPTVWSSDSQSLPETLLVQGFLVLATLLFPVTPAALVLHRLYDHVNGQIGHAGFEYFADRSTRFPSPMVCTAYHDLHHERFRWNFGNYFSFWDRLCGTLHPDYDGMVARLEGAAKSGEAVGEARRAR